MDLEVVGRHALFFDDDTNSCFVNSTDALVPYGENPSLLIDRYDVRHLLQRIPPYSRKNQKVGKREEHEGDGVPRSELDHQRYLDLPPEEEGREDGLGTASADSESKKVTEMTGSGGYQAVPFSYANVDDFSVQNNDIDLKHSGYHPPFSLPQALLSNLPPTEKLHQIIAKTAVFVSKHGGQSEIILRVKQGNNPTFGFLMPDHQLHAYFRYLVDHPELVDGVSNVSDGKDEKMMAEGQEKKSHVTVHGALSLLGSIYGSGDDDAETVQGTSSKDIEMVSSVNDATAMTSSKSGNVTSLTHTSMEDRTNMKPLAVAKEKSVSLRKNQPIVSLHSDNTGGKAKVVTNSGDVSRSQQHSKLSASEKIFEPSSTLKRMVDKIVEFIVKNGKEFEAILIEQDKPHGRFPFLLPSSVYHSYYLKILREAQETKILGNKNVRDLDHDLSVRAESTRKGRKTKGSTVYLEDTSIQDGTYDLERKEKFKMVIGGSKRDASELPPKTTKQPGVSADDAAAIVMAATRGLTSSKKHDDSAKKSAITADAVAAIVLQTTGGSISPSVSDTLGNGARSSSSGNLFALPPGQVSMRKQGSDSKLSTPVPADPLGSAIQMGGEGSDKTSNMILANVIAKTAAFAAASEADSSDASLNRKQKLKAERLKKAKMFAAMVKGSGDGGGKPKWFPPASIGLPGSQPVVSGSVLSGPVSDGTAREREGSSVPVTANAVDMVSAYSRGEHKSRKHRSSRHYDEDPDEDEESIKKKHRHSEHSSRHRRKRHHSSSKYKHSDSDEEERQPRKTSRSHRHHKRHSSSSDDEHLPHRNSYRHQRKSRHRSKKQESEDEDSLLRQESESEGSREASTRPQDAKVGASTSDAQATNGTEVSDDLRAKVRAMLLATM